jgi:hypothetical protein
LADLASCLAAVASLACVACLAETIACITGYAEKLARRIAASST